MSRTISRSRATAWTCRTWAAGSLGLQDPFIGLAHLPEADGKRYYVAIMSDTSLPHGLAGHLCRSTATRIGPRGWCVWSRSTRSSAWSRITSASRATRRRGPDRPGHRRGPSCDISTATELATHVRRSPWATCSCTCSRQRRHRCGRSIRPPATFVTHVGTFDGNEHPGHRDAFRRQSVCLPTIAERQQRCRRVGEDRYRNGRPDAGGRGQHRGHVADAGDILGPATSRGNSTPTIYQTNQVSTSDWVDALTFERLGTQNNLRTPAYVAVLRGPRAGSPTWSTYSSKLYRADPDTGSAAPHDIGTVGGIDRDWAGVLGDIQPLGVTKASVTIFVSDGDGNNGAADSDRGQGCRDERQQHHRSTSSPRTIRGRR